MEKCRSISVETRLERDGELILTGLPFRAGEHVAVQIGTVGGNGSRQFPMRGKPYRDADPFEPAMPPENWEAGQ